MRSHSIGRCAQLPGWDPEIESDHPKGATAKNEEPEKLQGEKLDSRAREYQYCDPSVLNLSSSGVHQTRGLAKGGGGEQWGEPLFWWKEGKPWHKGKHRSTSKRGPTKSLTNNLETSSLFQI